MPVMPIHNSQRNIKAGTAEPLRNEASKSFESDQKVIGAITETTQKWSDAHDVMQYTEAKGNYEVGVAGIQARAAQDPNFKDSDKYYKELQDAKNQSLVGISNKQVAEKAAMDMDFGNQMAAIKIDSNFKQKEIIANKFNLSQSIEGLQQKKLQAATSGEAAQIDQEIQELLNLNVATGVLTDAEAESIKDDANLLSAEFASAVTPDQFIENGAEHYGIPEDKYRDLKQEAIVAKERTKKQAIEAQDVIQEQSETDLVMALADKQVDRLSVSEITKKMITGEISTEFGDAYIRVLKSSKHIDRKKKIEKSGFTNFAKELFGSEGADAKRAAVVKMLDGAAEGELNEEQLAVLLKTADKAGKATGWISGAIDGLMDLGEARAKYSGERLVYDFFKSMLSGKEPEQAKSEAIDQEQIRTNPDRTKYEYGDTIETNQGALFVWGYWEDTGEPKLSPERPPKK